MQRLPLFLRVVKNKKAYYKAPFGLASSLLMLMSSSMGCAIWYEYEKGIALEANTDRQYIKETITLVGRLFLNS